MLRWNDVTSKTSAYLWKPLFGPVQGPDDKPEPIVADLVRQPDQHRRVDVQQNALWYEHLEKVISQFYIAKTK